MRIAAFIFPSLLLFASCGTKTTTEQITSSQWKLFNYLPYNTESIIYLNLDNLQKSDYSLDKIVTGVKSDSSNSWLSKFEENTGVGLNNGIAEIIIGTAEDEQNVFLVRFDDKYKKVKDYFNKSPDFIKNKTGDKETFILKQNPSSHFYFPENSILLLTKGKSLFESLTMDYGKRLKDNDKFISIIRNIESKNYIWIASDQGTFATEMFKRFAGKDSKVLSPRVLSSINNLSLCADFSNGIQIESVLGCSSAGDAYLLTSAVEGAVAMKIISRKDEQLGKIFDKMNIKREGDLIRFNVALTENELNDLRSLTKYNNQVNKF